MRISPINYNYSQNYNRNLNFKSNEAEEEDDDIREIKPMYRFSFLTPKQDEEFDNIKYLNRVNDGMQIIIIDNVLQSIVKPAPEGFELPAYRKDYLPNGNTIETSLYQLLPNYCRKTVSRMPYVNYADFLLPIKDFYENSLENAEVFAKRTPYDNKSYITVLDKKTKQKAFVTANIYLQFPPVFTFYDKNEKPAYEVVYGSADDVNIVKALNKNGNEAKVSYDEKIGKIRIEVKDGSGEKYIVESPAESYSTEYDFSTRSDNMFNEYDKSALNTINNFSSKKTGKRVVDINFDRHNKYLVLKFYLENEKKADRQIILFLERGPGKMDYKIYTEEEIEEAKKEGRLCINRGKNAYDLYKKLYPLIDGYEISKHS